jgi:hypothetical protein
MRPDLPDLQVFSQPASPGPLPPTLLLTSCFRSPISAFSSYPVLSSPPPVSYNLEKPDSYLRIGSQPPSPIPMPASIYLSVYASVVQIAVLPARYGLSQDGLVSHPNLSLVGGTAVLWPTSTCITRSLMTPNT